MTAIDPYRTLGLAPGATQAEIKVAYRQLAKLNHPDSAGERALPRFLAIQAAYEALVEDPSGLRRPSRGRPSTTGRPAEPPAAPWQADASRARATREAYRARTRDARGTADPGPAGSRSGPAPGPTGAPRPDGRGSSRGPAPDDAGAAESRARTRRSSRRPKATIGSTSYDGADKEPFDPAWEGATWYGAGSGTYWTLNPKEYADPRKHGPEYLARSKRGMGQRGSTGDPTRADEASDIPGAPAVPDDRNGPDAADGAATSSGRAAAGSASTSSDGSAAHATPPAHDATRPADDAPVAPERPPPIAAWLRGVILALIGRVDRPPWRRPRVR